MTPHPPLRIKKIKKIPTVEEIQKYIESIKPTFKPPKTEEEIKARKKITDKAWKERNREHYLKWKREWLREQRKDKNSKQSQADRRAREKYYALGHHKNTKQYKILKKESELRKSRGTARAKLPKF